MIAIIGFSMSQMYKILTYAAKIFITKQGGAKLELHATLLIIVKKQKLLLQRLHCPLSEEFGLEAELLVQYAGGC